MSKKIYIIGQSIEKTIVSLDKNSLLRDEQARFWLDSCLDNRAESVKSVISRSFELDLLIKMLDYLGIKSFCNQNNRASKQVILSYNHRQKILTENKHHDYLWQSPNFVPDYILLLSSANLSEYKLAELKDFLMQNQQVKLIVEEDLLLRQSKLGRELTKMATFSFIDGPELSVKDSLLRLQGSSRLRAVLAEDNLYLADKNQIYNFNKVEPVRLKNLVWLAIIISALDYQMNLKLLMSLIDKIATQVVQLKVPVVDDLVKQIDPNNQYISLLDGQVPIKQVMLERKQFLSDKIIFDLSQTKSIIASRFDQPEVAELVMINNLLRTQGINKSLSAIILSEQQFRLFNQSNKQLINNLISNNLIFGVRFDLEKQLLNGFASETITEGLDNINQRLEAASDIGAKFSNWQVEFVISSICPTDAIVLNNVHNLARFANISQSLGLLPVIKLKFVTKLKPEFDLKQALKKQALVIRSVITELKLLQVDLDNLILQFNLLENQGLLLNLRRLDEQLVNLAQIKDFTDNQVTTIIDSDNLDWERLTDFYQKIKHNPLVDNLGLSNRLIEQVLPSWQGSAKQTEQAKLRIKFSQVLAELKK